VHARAGRTGSGHGGFGSTKRAVGIARATAHRVTFDAFTQLRIIIYHRHLLTLSCTNGEYERISFEGGHSDVFYYLKGGGARYPYPKEVWTPAGALDELRRFAYIPLMLHVYPSS
jgi:hypothetical protein